MQRLPMQPRRIIDDPHEAYEQELAGAISPTNALREWRSPEGYTLVEGFRLSWQQEATKSVAIQQTITLTLAYHIFWYITNGTNYASSQNTAFLIGREALGDQWLLGAELSHPDAGHYWSEAE